MSNYLDYTTFTNQMGKSKQGRIETNQKKHILNQYSELKGSNYHKFPFFLQKLAWLRNSFY